MAKKTIFISYDYDYDKHWKTLLVAWDKNGEFDFTFYDASVDVSVNSTEAAVIKRVISARIKGATRFLCIVGKHTHKSAWVNWEIEKAVELKRRRCCMIQLRREWGRFSNFSFRTPQRRISAYPARPSG